jgi:hypothetical protein
VTGGKRGEALALCLPVTDELRRQLDVVSGHPDADERRVAAYGLALWLRGQVAVADAERERRS